MLAGGSHACRIRPTVAAAAGGWGGAVCLRIRPARGGREEEELMKSAACWCETALTSRLWISRTGGGGKAQLRSVACG